MSAPTPDPQPDPDPIPLIFGKVAGQFYKKYIKKGGDDESDVVGEQHEHSGKGDGDKKPEEKKLTFEELKKLKPEEIAKEQLKDVTPDQLKELSKE